MNPAEFNCGVAIGNIEIRHDETELEWKIPDFFTNAETKWRLVCRTFAFLDVSWFIQMFPKSNRKPGFVDMHLLKNGNLEYSVNYYFGLKKLDGSVSGEHLCRGIIHVESQNRRADNKLFMDSTDHFVFRLSEIQQRNSEFLSSDTLTVVCRLKCETPHSHQGKMLKAEMWTPRKRQKFMSK